MRTLISTVIFSTLLMLACCAGKKAVAFEELPQPLQSMISQHFPGESLSYALVEREDMGKKYDIVLSDGTEIEADGQGNWTEVKCARGKAVPAGIVPQQIGAYVSAKHPEAYIWKIENRRRGYEVELSNGLEIKFNDQFIVTDYDR